MRVQISSLAQMRTFAEVLAENLRAGDLLILSGNLGAGKTTFTQSLGRALDVAGRITSPTFVIAREHPSLGEGPALVHVDAYRLSDAEELEDLDLDSELDESITVVEWGEGLAEQLSADYLSLTITPVFEDEIGAGGEDDTDVTAGDDESEPDEHRIVDLHGHGDTWDERWQRLDASIRAIVTVTADEEDTA
ncbi:tRNA (adenosine(37)-N6)-threonylcarbamoyltransferase complex ATPase subunit type 1 TsaE [Brevibacterium sp. ZH18]|uniref:tRNA (adenosine(37)-N6)-threonylcarbamoyltransferase complex ATPase subunit type 1 TsaE n=1 Tax=Brevibacterium sp. ZH18 TaxID=2927784 RepID=UPI00325B6C6E